MNDFEIEILEQFNMFFLENYRNDLIDGSIKNCQLSPKIDINNIPFNSLYDMYNYLLNKYGSDNKSNLNILFYDAYLDLYANQKNEDYEIIKNDLENNNWKQEIELFEKKPLYGTMLNKLFLHFLLLNKNNSHIKDLSIQKASEKNLSVLNKFDSSNQIFISLNQKFKEIFYELYYYYKNRTDNEEETMNNLYLFFSAGFFPEELSTLIENVASSTNDFNNYQRILIGFLYETAYLAILDKNMQGKYANQIIEEMKKSPKGKLELPHNTKVRHLLYGLFIMEMDNFNPKVANKINSNDKLILKKYAPTYFLDFLDSFSY